MFLPILLYLFLEAALLQQLVCLVQNKQSDAGGGQHAQLDKLLDTTCVHNQERSDKTQTTARRLHKRVMPLDWPLTRWAHSYMALLQLEFVLTHRAAPDENMALEALHGAAYGHHYRVDLHRYLTCRSQDKNLQKKRGCLWRKLDVNNHSHLIGSRLRIGRCWGTSQSVRPHS